MTSLRRPSDCCWVKTSCVRLLFVWAAITAVTFLVVNGASFFLLSGPFLFHPGSHDTLYRAGFPFEMARVGGFSGYQHYSVIACLKNLGLTATFAFIVTGTAWVTARARAKDKGVFKGGLKP